jgi:hypothetical protein
MTPLATRRPHLHFCVDAWLTVASCGDASVDRMIYRPTNRSNPTLITVNYALMFRFKYLGRVFNKKGTSHEDVTKTGGTATGMPKLSSSDWNVSAWYSFYESVVPPYCSPINSAQFPRNCGIRSAINWKPWIITKMKGIYFLYCSIWKDIWIKVKDNKQRWRQKIISNKLGF